MKIIQLTDAFNYIKEYINVDFISRIEECDKICYNGSKIFMKDNTKTYVAENPEKIIKIINTL